MIKTGAIRLPDLYSMIEEAMKPGRSFKADDKLKREEFERLQKMEQEMKLASTDGLVEAREFMRNKITFLLGEMKDIVHQESVDEILSQYHVNYFENIYSYNSDTPEMTQIDREIEQYFMRFSIGSCDSFDRKLSKLAQIIYQELYGYSILDELIFDSEFNEVACNRYDYIWVQYRGIKRRIPNPDFRFASEQVYQRIIENRLTATAREEMNVGEPFINCTLKNGFRITAARPPLSRHFVVNVRLFTFRDIKPDARIRFMEDKMLRLIELLTRKGRRNIAIIGEQGSGKTTAADELIIKNLDGDLSIGLAEYTHELNISSNYPNKNVVEFQYGKEFQPSDITEMFFRFNRDIVIYGEVRSPAEAFEMIKAMLRQSRGSLFTFHSSSVRRMIHDLRQLLMQTGFYTDYREAQFDVADAVDIVIQIKLDRITGQRYVYRVSEVLAGEEDMSFEIKNLFVYDRERQKYLVKQDGLSKAALNSCLEYELSAENAAYIIDLFEIKSSEKDLFEYME